MEPSTNSDYVNTYLTTNARKQQKRPVPAIPTTSTTDADYSDYVNTYLKTIPGKKRPVPPVPIISTTDLKHVSSTDSNTSTADVTPITSFPPDFALISVLSKAFLRRVRGLENVRDLFCANEYPESFTGREAIVSKYTKLCKIGVLTLR